MVKQYGGVRQWAGISNSAGDYGQGTSGKEGLKREADAGGGQDDRGGLPQ